jgi:ATP-dependent helicase/DNAse subunit B
MPKDKFAAVWISHTSISDYLHCPRSYYLKNIYKDKSTGNKIQITSPALALGSAVHGVIESLSSIPTETRFEHSLILKFDELWEQYHGKKGGFRDLDQEHQFKERGKAMLRKVMDHPGPLKNLSVKIKEALPYYWISEAEEIILCGKLDWLEYLPETDSVHIIDFKTSRKEESDDSLQLPIYHLLVHNCQKRPVSKVSYWYLELSHKLQEKKLPDIREAHTKVLEIGRKIKLSRKLAKFSCPQGADGCPWCQPLEDVISGKGEFVGLLNRRDTYILSQESPPSPEDLEDSFLI